MKTTYYHVSKIDLGEKFKFTPKVPLSAVIEEEGDIPRICVSDDIICCIDAICGVHATVDDFVSEMVKNEQWIRDSPAVYSTKRTPYTPPNASDFRQNGEKWFLTPVTMKRIGYIDLVYLFNTGKVSIIKKFNRADHVITEDNDHIAHDYIEGVVEFNL